MLCPKCGTEVDGMQFCPNCGSPLQAHSNDFNKSKSRDDVEIVDFRVHRISQNNTSAVPISVFVDGYLYGSVTNGSTSEFQLIEGYHNITLRLANKTITKPFNVSKVFDCYIGVSGKPGSPVFFDDIPENYAEECRKKDEDEKVTVVHDDRRSCNKWESFIICLFFGLYGIHKFYEGKTVSGIVRYIGFNVFSLLMLSYKPDYALYYAIAAAVFIVAWIVDLIVIICKSNPYYAEKKKHAVPISLLVILLAAAALAYAFFSRTDIISASWQNIIDFTSTVFSIK